MFCQDLCCLKGLFSSTLKFLILRRKTLWFCFLSVLLSMKFHFSSLKRFCFPNAHPEYLKYCFKTALLRCSVMDRRVLGALCLHQERPSEVLMRTKRGLGLFLLCCWLLLSGQHELCPWAPGPQGGLGPAQRGGCQPGRLPGCL